MSGEREGARSGGQAHARHNPPRAKSRGGGGSERPKPRPRLVGTAQTWRHTRLSLCTSREREVGVVSSLDFVGLVGLVYLVITGQLTRCGTQLTGDTVRHE